MFHPLLHVISLLPCVMPISLNSQLADSVGWVVEGMNVDPVVMRSGKKNTNQMMGCKLTWLQGSALSMARLADDFKQQGSADMAVDCQ